MKPISARTTADQKAQQDTTRISRRAFLSAAGTLGAGLALGVKPAHPAALTPGKPLPRAHAARPLSLTAVRLTGGPLKRAQDLDRNYLLALEPDRMMAFFRTRTGLTPKAEGYGGWDGGGRNLTGHIAGHYLSAVSLMYAATGDARFQQRAAYLVREMQTVQDKDGYLGALQADKGVDGKTCFQELAHGTIRSGGFDLNGLWSPWYVQHKLFAGLRDAYRHTGSQNALAVAIQFAAWVEGTLSGLDDSQNQQMLRTEFGGMNEVLADLSVDTGDRRWLALSDKFEHRAVRDPLARHQDVLAGLHANTQVPKLIGSLTRYASTGNETDGEAARFFWDAVVDHHTFATGGHGKDEYFGPPDKLSEQVDGRTDESCNVYNMLKMTRELFALNPQIKYAEFHERALFNHVLGSIAPADAQMCYMVPVGRGVQREYQGMFTDFTCCVGTGMENHALHGHGLYYEQGNRLWVNLYAPSRAEWKSAGAHLTMETSFPEGDAATLRLAVTTPRKLTLALRRPSWAGDGFAVHVNGKARAKMPTPGSYVELTRTWKSGDIVTVALPKSLRLEPLPDNPRRAALLWGPLVLAGDMGPEGDGRPAPIALASAERPVAEWLKPVPGKAGCFRSDGVGRDTAGAGGVHDVTFTPFYRLHHRTYSAYWDLYTPSEWEQQAAEIADAQEKQRKLEAATVAYAQPGEMQTERDFHEQGEDTTPDRVLGRAGRRGRKWFSFDLPVDPAHLMTLVVTYSTQEFGHRTFDILTEGQTVGHQTVDRRPPGSAVDSFFDVEYAIPVALVQGKKTVTIRFEATGGNEIAAVFGLRIIRAGAPR